MQEMIDRFAGWAGLGFSILASALYGVRGLADLPFWLAAGAGLALLALYASRNATSIKASLGSRKTRLGANSVFLALAALAIASVTLAIVNNHNVSWDLTKGKVNTISDETERTMKNLGVEVQVYAFFDPSTGEQAACDALLKRVKAVNPGKFSYEFVNLNKKPLLAKQYSVRSYGTSVLVAGERSESIHGVDEEALVNALVKLGSSGSKSVYLVSGHGEAALGDNSPGGASELKKAFGNATFELKDLNLAMAGKIPADASALIIAGPRTDYLAPEVSLLRDWLAQGGRLILAADPRTRLPNLLKLADAAGVVLGNDITVDPIMRLFGSDPIAPLASTFDPSHPVTKDMRQGQQQLIFPLAQSVGLKDKLPEGSGGAVLATSNPTAWSYKGSGNRLPSKPGPGDKAGPVKLAAAVEGPGSVFKAGSPAGKNFRLVVYGTSKILANEGIALYNNQDLAVNSARWLADEEKRIAIAAKKEENQPLMLERSRMALMWWGLLLLPFAVLALGLGVLLRRRRAA